MMKSFRRHLINLTLLSALLACQPSQTPDENAAEQKAKPAASVELDASQKLPDIKPAVHGKPVIYQVMTRLFGNQKNTNKPWGTIEENGVGKFNDFTDEALDGIKQFGVTYIWYTGVLHHDVIGDYTRFGISNDDPDVVKGRAGSPYAVKDYYNVDPDLAVDPANRLQEFKALIERTHRHGMKVIIDIVPNHVARNYHSITNPPGVEDFGAHDDTSVEYARDNNFYYVVGKAFKVPEFKNGYQPLGGEKNPLVDGKFAENPAKWTGNGSRKAQPDFDDWYETVKINYGVKPDGTYDFDRLPEDYRDKSYQQHYAFWQNKSVPDSWKKYRDITLYWLDMGVDGFRYDIAELVPVEFWSYMNSAIKQKNPDAFLMAEVYNRKIYRDFIQLGKMDYLYDKVDLYDTLKLIMQGKAATSQLLPIVEKFKDIEPHLLHFLENHDEQRIASPEFAGSAEKGKPAMVVTTLLTRSPTMLYFGQALGEAGEGDAGFGHASRTTIFDYWGVPSVQRWNDGGKFDGGQLSEKEKALRNFYARLLSYSAQSSALNGAFADLHAYNLHETQNYNESLFSFSRWSEQEKIIVVCNFSYVKSDSIKLQIPESLIAEWQLADGKYPLNNVLAEHTETPEPGTDATQYILNIEQGKGEVIMSLAPLESLVLQF